MKNEQTNMDNTEVLDNTATTPVETEYVDEFGNPIDPSLIDEFGNYIGNQETQYVDEFGNPIDPSLIDEFGNYIGDQTTDENTLNLDTNQSNIKESLNEVSATTVESSSAHQMDDKELMQGMVTFDYNNVPITDIVNSIILDAINKGASDIHFDPFDDGIKIRIRIDGQLNDYSIVPLFVKKNMITRVKIISGMNITESRVPQDGAIRTELANKTIDLRVSCLPTNMGEKIVVRIMDYSMSAAGVEALDFNEKNLDKVKKMLALPNGIILVTGATGSGKSTTVYSMLQRLNVEGTNLITVEDPIEMNIGGVNQVQAVSEIGLTFATVLRSILRQDPDVIMIGEIRDDETARIAVRASITGHLVLSTIHTNNSLNTIERLTDMSVERYLLGTALSGIVSQKLARRLCDKCKRLRKTNDYEKEILKKVLDKDVDEIYEPVGCSHCARGYRGRIAIQEVLLLNQTIKDAITKGVDKKILRNLVYGANGTETMLEDGLEKVLQGKTSFDEIIKLIDLEDDLGTGSQLGLEDQIEASKMDQVNTSPINLGNNPININITPELLSSLSGLNNLQNLTPQLKNNEKTDKDNDEEVIIKEEPVIESPIVDIPDDEEVIIKDDPVEELKTEINEEDIPVFPEVSIPTPSNDEEIDALDDYDFDVLPDEEITVTDDQPVEQIENEEINIIDEPEILEDAQEDIVEPKQEIEYIEKLPPIEDVLYKFQNNLNQIGKRKFILKTKELISDLDKYDIHSDEVIKIVKNYIDAIKASNRLKLNDKKDLINLFNRTFGINEQIDEIDELTEESLETIDKIENSVNNIDLSEQEIDSILEDKTDDLTLLDLNDTIDQAQLAMLNDNLSIIDEKPEKDNKPEKKKNTTKEKAKDKTKADEAKDIEDIPELSIDDDDTDFSAIDDSIINSMLDSLDDIKEDNE